MVLETVKPPTPWGGGWLAKVQLQTFAAIWRLWLDKGTTLRPEPLNECFLRCHPASAKNAADETENLKRRMEEPLGEAIDLIWKCAAED